ncbi:hypothetical protein V6N12_009891 [Hibiscus sabdariffa]|uniref:Uncharacterized protein n=1 Tax=Hibiscus sabdariffa TaxID=183260 RepID=A0ABR2EC15_9ROSI
MMLQGEAIMLLSNFKRKIVGKDELRVEVYLEIGYDRDGAWVLMVGTVHDTHVDKAFAGATLKKKGEVVRVRCGFERERLSVNSQMVDEGLLG